MSTRVIIDSTTDLPEDFRQEYGICMLPLYVIVDGVEYLDKVTITTNEIYARMRAGSLPRTAQVNIVDTQNTLEDFLRAGEDLIYLAFSSKMSGTCQLVAGIMEELKEVYPERKMVTLDSRGGCFATGLIAMETAKLAKADLPFEDIVSRSRFLIDHVEHVFVISDLTWMIRGGRISKTLGYTANLLNIKPVLDVNEGEMEVIHKIRGRRPSLKKVADIVAERAAKDTPQLIGITHADDLEAAQEMQRMLEKRLPDCSYCILEIGAVLGVHLGIGGVGVFFFNEL